MTVIRQPIVTRALIATRQPLRLALPALVGLLCAACGGNPYERFEGATMGTYYAVTARCASGGAPLGEHLRDELEQVNAEMSTYLPTSTLSRFNASGSEDWFDVEPSLVTVVDAAAELSRVSGGAFDVTVGPLVNAWGFGPPRPASEPTAAELAEARSRVGFERLASRPTPPALRKVAGTYVDLSAIAKGHGVDRLAAVLDGAGCSDYLVDIGGEVRGRGRNARGQLWRVGVEVPDPSRQGAVQRIVELDDMAVATSGDYRNYREQDGVRISHTIDPRSGAPVAHGLASVTVLHRSTMWADGFATALNVLGPEEALALAERLELPVLLLVRGGTGFEERYNKLMQRFLRPR